MCASVDTSIKSRSGWIAAVLVSGMPSLAYARSSLGDEQKSFMGWLIILGSVGLTVLFVVWFNKRTGGRTVRADLLSSALPADSSLSVDALHVRYERRFETTGHSVYVTGNTGHVRTHGRPYKVLDFGYTVRNRSSQHVRFQMSLSPTGPHGQTVGHDAHSWIDLRPGETRMMWFGFSTRDPAELLRHRVSALSFGRAPVDGGMAQFEFTTAPQQSLYTLLGCAKVGLWRLLPLGPGAMLVAFGCIFVLWSVALVAAVKVLSM
jgi:hypothetical protein